MDVDDVRTGNGGGGLCRVGIGSDVRFDYRSITDQPAVIKTD